MPQPPKQLELCFVEADTASPGSLSRLPAADRPQYIAGRISPGQRLHHMFKEEVLLRKVFRYLAMDPDFIDTYNNQRNSLPVDR